MSTTRHSRPLGALRPGFFGLDDRTPRRLLADTPALAALFNFYDTTAAPAARWSRFYEQVPLVRYAGLAEIDTIHEAAVCRALLNRLQDRDRTFHFDPHDTLQLAAVRALVTRLLQLYRRLDRDTAAFSSFPGELSFAAILRQAIKQVFAADYRAVFPWRHWLEMAVDRHFPPLHTEWWGEPPLDGNRDDPRALYQATWSTLAGLGQLVPQAQAGFTARFGQPAGLPPHFALYLAFLRQFGGAQAALNSLPTRHRDFFYREVLCLAPAPAQPDMAFVSFLAAPDSSVDLPAGTQLTAGKDTSGLPIIYALARDTRVTNATIAQLVTLWVGSDSFALARHVASAGPSWATFGEDQSQLPAGAPRTMTDTQLGFALSSPTLHLEEGTRQITLTVAFAAPAVPAVSPITSGSGTIATPIPFGVGQLSYSGPSGWVPVDPALVTFKPSPAGSPPTLTISFTLEPAAAPCVNYDPKILGPGFDPNTPVLRVIFSNPLTALDPICRSLAVATVSISLAVSGLRNIILTNAIGKLVPGKPLPLFGAPPRPDATLLIGNVEVFRKQLTALSLQATWQGLPTEAPDLRPYFAPYLAMLTNPDPTMFRSDRYAVALSALVGGAKLPLPLANPTLLNWTPPSPAVSNPPLPASLWTVAPATLAGLAPVPALAGPLAYSPQSGTGFLSLTLAAPDYLFGQPLYATVLAQVAAQNALTMIAASRTPSSKPKPAAIAASLLGRGAIAILKQPAKLGILESLGRLLRRPAKPLFTLSSNLFDELKKIPALPATVAHAIESAGGVKAAELHSALTALKGKRFADSASLRQLLADAVKLDPKSSLAADAINLLLQALAKLLLPPTKIPDDSDPDSSLSSSSGSSGSTPAVDILPLPPPPLTPTAGSLTLDYSASVEFTLPATASNPPPSNPAWDRLWHISPLSTYPATVSQPLLPKYLSGGYLYLGLGGVQPPETATLLFIMESVSEKSLAALDAAKAQPLRWACLEGDTWREATPTGTAGAATATSDFSAQNVNDGTCGFQRTGIVRIELPPGADLDHTVMPGGYVWLRVFAPDPGLRLRTVQILAHATAANWVPPVGAPAAAIAAHFAQPLPAGALNALVIPNPSIAKINQPLASSGGAPAEDVEAFCTRASERLRHKGRAVAAPDYERLLLQHFPAVFSALALAPASAADAGRVTLVVLPTVTTVPANPPPMFLPGDLAAMASGLQAVAPLAATVEVENPTYVWLTVNLSVVFRPDRSFKAYAAQLSASLNAFISPWIYAQSTVDQPQFDFQLSELTAYIRKQLAYVELLGPCTITGRDHQGAIVGIWTNRGNNDPVLAPDSRRKMFVGVPAHDITLLANGPA